MREGKNVNWFMRNMNNRTARVTTAFLSTTIAVIAFVMAVVLMGHIGQGRQVKAFASPAASSTPATATDVAAVKHAVSKLPLVFEPNRGQTDPRVQYVARSTGYAAFVTGPSQAVLKIRNEADQSDVLTMNLAGADAKAKGGAIEKTGGVSNYYIGNDRSKWLEGVPNYAKVRYNDVYPGVDVVYQGDESRFRYDFVVKPGADPNAICLSFNGARDVHADADGSLVMTVGKSNFYASSKPFVYQEIGGKKHPVETLYAFNGNEARFKIGAYDKSKELVIDPYFTTASYLGAPNAKLGNSHINAIASGTNTAINNSGSIFVTGYTVSLNFPTVSAYQGAYGGTGNDGDAFVARMPYNMQSLTYSTYFGGSSVDVGTAIGVDSLLNAVVAGYTQSALSFPSMNPIEPGTPTPAQHIFVAKFTATGSLVNSSVLFGNGSEKGLAIAVEPATGIAHLTGATASTNFLTAIPVVTLGQQTANASITSSTNAFYLKLVPSGSTFTVALGTYLGGSGTDQGNAIAIDPVAAATVVIVGNTTSVTTPFPITRGPVLVLVSQQGFITQISTSTGKWSGGGYTGWGSSYIGGNGLTAGTAAAIDYAGNIYAGGQENNAFGTALIAPVSLTLKGAVSTGGQDGFLLMITKAGTVSANSTLVNAGANGTGGLAADVTQVTGLAVDSLNQLYVSGASSTSTDVGAKGFILRRRAFAGLTLIASSPFLDDYPNQETNSGGNSEVSTWGDLPLAVAGTTNGTAPNAVVANGAANGVTYDPVSTNSCFGGFVSQQILTAATPTVNSVIPPTAYQNNTSTAAPNYDTGIVGCATYNSDTIIQVGGATTNNPTFAFTLPVGTTSSSPASSPFTLVNFDPSFPNPTFQVSATAISPAITLPATIPFNTGNYVPNTTSHGGLWLNVSAVGDTITVSINTTNAQVFDPGVYTATFWVTPQQGDNAGVPQEVTATLTVTGQLLANEPFGGGIPMSLTVPNGQCTAAPTTGPAYSNSNSNTVPETSK